MMASKLGFCYYSVDLGYCLALVSMKIVEASNLLLYFLQQLKYAIFRKKHVT